MSLHINRKNSSNAPKGAFLGGAELDALDAKLKPFAEQLLSAWCGSVEIQGDEIVMRNPLRDDQSPGSFKFNTETGAWADFAMADFAGHGLTMLHCRLKGLPLGEGVKRLQAEIENLDLTMPQGGAPPARQKPKVDAVDPDTVMLPPDFHPELGFPSHTWKYCNNRGELVFYVYRFEIDGKKETRPLAYSIEKNRWLWQFPTSSLPLYRLPELLERAEAPVVVCEGEKAADAGARQFPQAVVVTSARGSHQALFSDWAPLKNREVVIAPDKDEPGRHYALAVASIALAHGAASVQIIDVWSMPDWKEGDDLADHEVPPGFLDNAVDIHHLFEPSELEPHLVAAAAGLGRGEFDRRKKALAESLEVGVRTLEGMVKDARRKGETDTDPEVASTPFTDAHLEPWDAPVPGESLFAELTTLIKRYMVITDAQAATVACWIIFSYGFERMRICPQLLINSPSKRCGKSTLLELIMCLVLRPLPAANISPSAVFRSIQEWKPTLLIDEADTFLQGKGNEEITGILNSGHNRNLAFVIRTQEVNGQHVPAKFSTFGPKVIAMIKTPADTIIDRSIVITLARKLAVQRVEALGIDARDEMQDTRRRILRWVMDNLDEVTFDIDGAPSMPNDRARQNWAVLAAFARVLGPAAHAALLEAAGELSDTSDIEDNLELDLLSDIRDVLQEHKQAHIQSAALVKELLKLKERPWGEINRGKELTENKLARLLKPFKIAPTKFRDGFHTCRGYSATALQEVFDHYLQSVTEGAA